MFGRKKDECDHYWEVLESYRFDSQLDKFNKLNCSEGAMYELSKRGIITVCQCKICGEVEHIETVF